MRVTFGNTGEAMFGAAMAGTFGIVAAFSLVRTGNLWFAIGMHAGWDWAETFFFGTPNSGRFAKGRLFGATFHGSDRRIGRTGGQLPGSVGPRARSAGDSFSVPARPSAPLIQSGESR